MYLTKKNIKNAEILGAMMRCPFDETVSNCPFKIYHGLNNPVKQIETFYTLPEEEVKSLQQFHRNCIRERCEKEKYSEDI
ncbi:hypothetical protein D1164_01385 [Mariniphaga sediminis]|uniref:Uncharacterized protein n=1 Tax=Mariniphaga sediminis TaxID=1628158 RepID=A0A399DA99_9BACT|nr:hypothetical protein [Mariniphaga sediminis]RIH67111.1 hypothetical protein D1164_01385 [Mariniphaga sediminis]